MMTQGQKGKSTGVSPGVACFLADVAAWMPSIMPRVVGSPWICLRGTWTASSLC